MLKVGILSDTHGFLDPAIKRLFQGVDHILHAGDIGMPRLILELEEIAPVTAVLGNTDDGLACKETESVTLGGRKFLVHHIVDVNSLSDQLERQIAREKPDVVVFGHTHKPYCQSHGKTLFFNPGYSGRPKFDQSRSVAVLHCDDSGIRAEYFELE